MKPPKVSLVIRCFNEAKHIGKLLYGITAQDYEGDWQIVVVDSGSTDRTVEIAEQYPVELVEIQPEDFSFGRALNLGCRHADGEILVFASAHVYPLYEDWLSSIVKPFEDERIAAVYGKQRGGPETCYSERQVFARWFPEMSVKRQETPFCNNANCAVRREIWQKLPYDEELTGLEDLAWAKQVMEMGYRISYAADAVIAHIHEESPWQVKNRYMREAIALKRIYPEQDMSFADFLRLFVQNTVTDYAHAAVEQALLPNVLDIPRFRFMQFWGAYRGFKQSGPVTERLRRTFYYPRQFPAGKRGSTDTVDRRRRIDYQRGTA